MARKKMAEKKMAQKKMARDVVPRHCALAAEFLKEHRSDREKKKEREEGRAIDR